MKAGDKIYLRRLKE